MEPIYSHGDLVISKLCDTTNTCPLLIEHIEKNDCGCANTLIICATLFLIAMLAFIGILIITKRQMKALSDNSSSKKSGDETFNHLYYVKCLVSLREELAKKDSHMKSESDESVQNYIKLLENLSQPYDNKKEENDEAKAN